ncbi:recombinase family protein [Bradyrhizobium sp. STM 3557]|uniref:recombinase family protein n=1 Tax=Bradyrhizobium sp. STM 3557 TaxID=578920 RepID=UPI00388FA298
MCNSPPPTQGQHALRQLFRGVEDRSGLSPRRFWPTVIGSICSQTTFDSGRGAANEVAVVRRIFSRFLQVKSEKAIAHELNEEGTWCRGRPWHPNTIDSDFCEVLQQNLNDKRCRYTTTERSPRLLG